MSASYPEVPRNSAEYAWMASIIRAVEARSGRATRWNGKLYEEPVGAGRALDDGGLTVSVAEVLKPVSTAYAAGRPLTDIELLQAKDAVLTAVHEAKHLIPHLGDDAAPGAVPALAPDALALEEGLAEGWALRNVDAVIRDIGMDRAVPSLVETRTYDGYPTYTAATDELIQGAAELAGIPPDQLREQLELADRSQRWATIADAVIEHQLGDEFPAGQRDHARAQLVEAMRPKFAAVVGIHKDEHRSDEVKVADGRTAARQTVAALSTTVVGLENRYLDQQQALQQSADRPGHPAGQTQASEQEVAELRRLTSGVAPAAGAVRAADPGQESGQGSGTPGRGPSQGLATVHPIRRNPPPAGQTIE